MYVCVLRGGCCPHVVVGVLVVWWFGGLVVGGACGVCGVGVCGVSCGAYTLVLGSVGDLVRCAHVCVFLMGCCPHCGLVVWVCRWCVDGGVAPLWFGVLVMWCVCPSTCAPEGMLPRVRVGVGVLVV